MKINLMLVLVTLAVCLCSCSSNHDTDISPHYFLRTESAYTTGHTSVRFALWGRPIANPKNKAVSLCESVKAHVGVFDPPEGGKIIFVGRSESEDNFTAHVFLCSDGANVKEVTQKVIKIGKRDGSISSRAEYGRDYLFDGADSSSSGMVVLLRVIRGDAGFGDAVGVRVTWDELNGKNEPTRQP